MNQRVILALLLSFCTVLSALGQSQPTAPGAPAQRPQNEPAAGDQDDVVKITTNLVQVDAVVTKDGKPVTGLTAQDFEIYEDGKRQTITSFAYISNVATINGNAPSTPPAKANKSDIPVPTTPIRRDVPRRTIAIVVDDLGLSAESMIHVRRQVRKFIAEQLEPNDLVAVIRTGGEMGALQQFTNDKRLLNRAVDLLRWNACSRTGINVIPRVGIPVIQDDNSVDPCGGHSTRQTAKALRFIIDAMAQLPGRKSMILMSDNLPIEDQEQQLTDESGAALTVAPDRYDYSGLLRKIAEKAIRSSVVIYSVDTQGLQYTGLTAADSLPGNLRGAPTQINSIMSSRSLMLQRRREGGELIAKQTGGFQVRNSNDFGLPRILEDQTGYYLLGYRPTDETFNRRFHHIKAKVKRSGMTLRTRYGFFGVSEEDANRRKLTAPDVTNLALMSPFGAQDIELQLTSFFASDPAQGSIVRSFAHVAADNFTFNEVDGRKEARLEIDGVIFGDNGVIVGQIRRGARLSLPDAEYQQALREGLRLQLDMPVKRAGSFQVRIAVKDAASSRIGSAGQFVAVPDLRNKRLAVSGIVLRAVSDSAPQSAVMANPAIRRFAVNSNLYFALAVYNATIDPASKSSNLTMETKLFRDEKVVSSTAEAAVDMSYQPDPERVFVHGVVRLGPELEPGSYYLQVLITDRNLKNKQPPVVQWVDFEIVK